MDSQLDVFKRQYLQLCDPDFFTWPPQSLLRDVDVQSWIYRELFAQRDYLPPERYEFRVLKLLIKKIEQAIQDPEEDEISDLLLSRLSDLLITNIPSELTAAQQQSYVTFSYPPEISITLLERRNLISGSQTTGFRTWEAALHLATFLISTPYGELVKNKSVIELGAGTGFISILFAKYFQATHVTATDGDENVIDTLKENLALNKLDTNIQASVLRWGSSSSWVADDCEQWPYDIAIGADIIYDKTVVPALVATFSMLFAMRPGMQVLLSSVIRNADTFETFRHACVRQNFYIEELSFEMKPTHQQAGFFYATIMPIKILLIKASNEEL